MLLVPPDIVSFSVTKKSMTFHQKSRQKLFFSGSYRMKSRVEFYTPLGDQFHMYGIRWQSGFVK